MVCWSKFPFDEFHTRCIKNHSFRSRNRMDMFFQWKSNLDKLNRLISATHIGFFGRCKPIKSPWKSKASYDPTHSLNCVLHRKNIAASIKTATFQIQSWACIMSMVKVCIQVKESIIIDFINVTFFLYNFAIMFYILFEFI